MRVLQFLDRLRINVPPIVEDCAICEFWQEARQLPLLIGGEAALRASNTLLLPPTGVSRSGVAKLESLLGAGRSATSVQAIREEARTTLWNLKYIEAMQREGPTAAANLTETVRNMDSWNVMQPSAFGRDMWDET